MISGTATSVTYYAYDRTTSQAKTGDAANHTIRVVHDGTEITPAGAPAEIDATNMPGWYKIALTGAENTGGFMLVGGKSSTANINIQGQIWINEASSPTYETITINSGIIVNDGGINIVNTAGIGIDITGGPGDYGLRVNSAQIYNSGGHTGAALAVGQSVGSHGTAGQGVYVQGNGFGDAVVFEATSNDRAGIQCIGNGAGAGMLLTAGDDGGSGLEAVGGHAGSPAGSGAGIKARGTWGPGIAVSTEVASFAAAMTVISPSTDGIDVNGGIHGVLVSAGGGGDGIQLNTSGNGAGLNIVTANGAGINLLGVVGGEPIAYTVVDAASNPGTNATFDRRFAWMSNLAQFKLDESSSQQRVYAADGTTVISTAAVTDATGLTTRDAYS